MSQSHPRVWVWVRCRACAVTRARQLSRTSQAPSWCAVTDVLAPSYQARYSPSNRSLQPHPSPTHPRPPAPAPQLAMLVLAPIALLCAIELSEEMWGEEPQRGGASIAAGTRRTPSIPGRRRSLTIDGASDPADEVNLAARALTRICSRALAASSGAPVCVDLPPHENVRSVRRLPRLRHR